jgi:hypothetical protein
MDREPMKYIDEQNPLHVLSAEIFKLFREYREEWLKDNTPDDLIWIFNGNEQAIVSYNINFKIPEYNIETDTFDRDVGNIEESKEVADEVRDKLATLKKENNYEGLPKKLVKKLRAVDAKKEKIIKDWKGL